MDIEEARKDYENSIEKEKARIKKEEQERKELLRFDLKEALIALKRDAGYEGYFDYNKAYNSAIDDVLPLLKIDEKRRELVCEDCEDSRCGCWE